MRDGLDKECEVMIEQIRGVSKKRILKSLTVLNEKEMQKIQTGLKALLNIE